MTDGWSWPWNHPCRGTVGSAYYNVGGDDDKDDEFSDEQFLAEIPGSDGGTHRVFRLENCFACEECGKECAVPEEFERTECDSE